MGCNRSKAVSVYSPAAPASGMAEESKIELGEGKGGQPVLQLVHSSGASVTVYLHGGTVTSWKTSDGQERLFLSEAAVFNGAKPIRGGIPLVFPQFGGGELPSHGFARRSTWSVVEAGDGHGVVRLEPTPAITEMWPHPFRLDFTIDFDATTLTTRLAATNTGKSAFKFQALQHTYLRVEDVTKVSISGLAGCVQMDSLLDMDTSETDSIYVQVSGKPVSIANVKGAAGMKSVATATMDGKAADNDVVVWNPWVDKSKRMADFGDDEYPSMLCIEPGFVSAWNTLPPGSTWALTQVLTPTPAKL